MQHESSTPSLIQRSSLCPNLCHAEWSREGAKAVNADAWTSPARHASVEEAEAAARRPAEPLDLLSCVQAFLQREQLDAEDTWYCSRCKQHVQADKKLDLWSLPEVLVVHLKRFSYSRYSRDKLDTPVTFPLRDLDLSSHLLRPARPGEAPARYDLYAVSNHYGGMGGGHYTATCKMPDDGLWYLFDDSSVRSVPDAQVQSPAAYVLFYRRQGSKVGCWGWVRGMRGPCLDMSMSPPCGLMHECIMYVVVSLDWAIKAHTQSSPCNA